ncbi:hypothetical protein C0995_015229 [Termitomyces sp. Mi166|nr:hypothetical protein C0995_015229 [Termitomyces sp. Mi166\
MAMQHHFQGHPGAGLPSSSVIKSDPPEIYHEIENRFQYYRDLPDEPGHDGKKGGKKWQVCGHYNSMNQANMSFI